MKKEIKLIAGWWAAQLMRPTFDNGDNSTTGGMTMGLMAMIAAQHVHEVTEESIAVFKQSLTSQMEEYFDKWGVLPELFVDYHAHDMLLTAANIAGINESLFPIKSGTFMSDGKPYRRLGYGGEKTEIVDQNQA